MKSKNDLKANTDLKQRQQQKQRQCFSLFALRALLLPCTPANEKLFAGDPAVSAER